MSRWNALALTAVYLASVAVRLAPVLFPWWDFSIWGSDTGEYYAISRTLANGGTLEPGGYEGWGFAYPYFPGMYFLVAALSFCGLDIQTALVLAVPAVSSLAVLPMYLIGVEITGDRRVGLLSAALTGLAVFHVYPTSHPMPGSLASLLALTCMYLLVVSYRRREAQIPLFICVAGLVVTHHLTVYFLLLAVGTITVVRLVFGHREDLRTRCRRDLTLLTALFTIAMAYWTAWAGPFSGRILTRGAGVPVWAIAVGGYAAIGVLWLASQNRERMTLYTYWPGARRPWKPLVRFFATFGSLSLILLVTILVSVPGTGIDAPTTTVVYFFPYALLGAFASLGTTFLRRVEDGFFVYAWTASVAVSFFVSAATGSQELLAYRHSQYIMEPGSVLIACGIVGFPRLWTSWRRGTYVVGEVRPPGVVWGGAGAGGRATRRRTATGRPGTPLIPPGGAVSVRASLLGAVVVVLLLTSVALGNYPPKGILGGFEEGTSAAEMDGVMWVREEAAGGRAGPGGDGLVLSDHRMSSMVFGYAGANASWDQGGDVLWADDLEGDETVDAPSGTRGVTYALISADMEEGTALEQWKTARPLEGEPREKFDRRMWKVFDNGDAAVYGPGTV